MATDIREYPFRPQIRGWYERTNNPGWYAKFKEEYYTNNKGERIRRSYRPITADDAIAMEKRAKEWAEELAKKKPTFFEKMKQKLGMKPKDFPRYTPDVLEINLTRLPDEPVSPPPFKKNSIPKFKKTDRPSLNSFPESAKKIFRNIR